MSVGHLVTELAANVQSSSKKKQQKERQEVLEQVLQLIFSNIFTGTDWKAEELGLAVTIRIAVPGETVGAVAIPTALQKAFTSSTSQV